MRLAEAMGLDIEDRCKVYHQAILRYVGCNADTHLLAMAFGDEIALRQDLAVADLGSQTELGQVFVRAFSRFFADMAPDELNQAVQAGFAEALQVSVPILMGHCEVAQRIGERLGLGTEMREDRGQLYERWDGNGLPRHLKGAEVSLPVRLVSLAQDVISQVEARGFDAMTEAVTTRRGGAIGELAVPVSTWIGRAATALRRVAA